MATKTQVLNWFRGQLGYAEGRRNANRYAKPAGHANNQPWCATFLVAGFRASGMKLGNESAYTPSLYNSMKGTKIGGPQVGAIAFLYFPSMGRIAHVGIVESVRPDGRFVNIEGNTNVAGSRTGGQVMRKVRSRSGWSFVMPNYTAPAPAPKPPAVIAGGVSVKRIQAAVRAPADGQWGPTTEKHLNAVRHVSPIHGGRFDPNVKFVQKVVGTAQDGRWGPASAAAHKATVSALQRALRAAGFDPTGTGGTWGTHSERAYQAARAKLHR